MSRRPASDVDDGGVGAGIRNRFSPSAAEALAPQLRTNTSAHLLSVGRCTLMGSGDRRPPVLRAGSMAHASLPSRMGNTLRWPDGRVTPAHEVQA